MARRNKQTAPRPVMDKIRQWPGLAIRIYGNRRGAELFGPVIGEQPQYCSRADAAKLIVALRGSLRNLAAR